jgi:hypothetical protein
MGVLGSVTRRTQTVGPETLPATVMSSTSVSTKHSAVVEEGLTEVVQGKPRPGFVMCLLEHLLSEPQLPQLLLHIVLEAWWLVVLVARVATQP